MHGYVLSLTPDTAVKSTPKVVRCHLPVVYAAILSFAFASCTRSAWTQEVLRFTAGTSASSKDLAVAGRGFSISRMKYLAPML